MMRVVGMLRRPTTASSTTGKSATSIGVLPVGIYVLMAVPKTA
jgi:hypothetical protein